jgi:molybdenum cofactor biosynthesis protein B
MSRPSEHGYGDRNDVRVGVVTVSASRSAAAKDGKEVRDESGDGVCALANARGFRVTFRRLVTDDLIEIRRAFTEGLATGVVDALVFVGGTGVAASDVTPEAVEPMLEKALPGFGELFRQKSSQKTEANAVLSRAMAGTVGKVAVFCLPGSPDGSALGMEIALEVLPHMKGLLAPV